MVKTTCKVCGAIYEVKPYQLKTSVSCSPACRYKWVAQKLTGRIRGPSAVIPWNKGMKGIHLSPQSEFKKGLVPWNKEKKGIHLSPHSEFKSGLIPENKLPVLSITQRVDKQGKTRNWIKIAEPNVWEAYARWVWTQAFGSIEEDMVIHHENEIADDDRIENLRMLSKPDHARVHEKNLDRTKH